VSRSRKEASNLARHIAVLTRQRGADFAELAREYSEDPVAQESGGYLGIFRVGEMVLPFEVAVKNMRIGQTGVVTETEYGFHIIKRHPIKRVHAHHILIAWRDAANVSSGVRRTQEQARRLAEEVRAMAVAKDADLCQLALRFSDDPNNSSTCGDIGLVEPGLVEAAFETALFRLRPGQVSEVVESDYGYHIIWRHE
jgi:peptidyl-prolyl cis-trans isomerase SurA